MHQVNPMNPSHEAFKLIVPLKELELIQCCRYRDNKRKYGIIRSDVV